MAKRALLVGVADIHGNQPLQPRASVAVVAQLLQDLGGWMINVVEGTCGTRDTILTALRQLASEVGADDDVFFYFFGHGGVVRFKGSPLLGSRPYHYIAAARPGPKVRLTGVFDFELSAILAKIDETCKNVSAILDCCHAANIVRSMIPTIAPPAWLVPLAPESLTEEGHPRIVRLAGSSSMRSGFARKHADGDLGLLTEGFVEVVREADLQVDRLTWDTVAHRVRERAINARGTEIQWVTLAGPRHRLLFSREFVPLPRSVGFVGGAEAGEGWLRAGLMQGVETGDVWTIAALRIGPDRAPEPVAQARVIEVGLNRARVQLLSHGTKSPADGSSALLMSAQRKAAIAMDDVKSMENAIARSGLLRPAVGERTVLASVCSRACGLELRREGPASITVHVSDPDDALSLLEDWARAERLARLVQERAKDEPPLEISWGRYAAGEKNGHIPLPTDGTAVLHVGEDVFFKIAHRRLRPESWFVSVVEINVAGRPTLVTTNEPDGVEVLRGHSVCIGRRSAAGRGGLRIDWSPEIPHERPQVATVMFLISQRPIQLGHLVRLGDHSTHLLAAVPRSVATGVRGHRPRPLRCGPTLSGQWGLQVIRYELHPRSRDTT